MDVNNLAMQPDVMFLVTRTETQIQNMADIELALNDDDQI